MMKINKTVEKWLDELEKMKQYYETLEDKKQTRLDNGRDKWLESEAAMEVEEDLGNISEIVLSLIEIIDNINSAYE